jgi:opacity protein-like surface antigen
MNLSKHSLLTAMLALTFSTAIVNADDKNTLSSAEKKAGWSLLFDGKDASPHWRNFKKEGISDGWKVENGELNRYKKGAGDIITKKQFDAFELTLDFKISKGGNSGLMFHVTEEESTPWRTGPEIQIQDNVDGHDPQKAGWLYQLYKADIDATKPAGEWNTLRILITPEKCVHWMNGKKYVEYVKGSKDWDEKVAASKFSKFAKFGKATKGHICLQDHNNLVSFRNIKIREVK